MRTPVNVVKVMRVQIIMEKISDGAEINLLGMRRSNVLSPAAVTLRTTARLRDRPRFQHVTSTEVCPSTAWRSKKNSLVHWSAMTIQGITTAQSRTYVCAESRVGDSSHDGAAPRPSTHPTCNQHGGVPFHRVALQKKK